LADIQKKTRFIEGILDKDYNAVTAICRHDTGVDFEETVRRVRTEAKSKGKLKVNKIVRQANTYSNKPSPKGQVKGNGHFKKKNTTFKTRRKANYTNNKGSDDQNGNETQSLGLPREVWNKMNQRQKELYSDARDKKEGYQGNQGYGKQYTKANNAHQNAGDKEDNGGANKDNAKPSGNIWRTNPKARVASMMSRVIPSNKKQKIEDQDEGKETIIWPAIK
jgi:hypothetical protein